MPAAELERVGACRDRLARARGTPRGSGPAIAYPPELPVSERRDEIAAAIREHQVVIVCGETGSGKTTQLPKICLELGRGIARPDRPYAAAAHRRAQRRRAHRAGARHASSATAVGYKVRFTDHTRPDAYIKLMTDGILLAETQRDRMLAAYDTIIIDEAHERSLNIDFLLGLSQAAPAAAARPQADRDFGDARCGALCPPLRHRRGSPRR